MYTLLIAEPSEIYTAVLREALGSEYDITCCPDGDTALELLSKLRPDILILNFMLPYKDGLTLLLETPHKPHVIIGMSAMHTPYIVQRAHALGVDQLLVCPKPSCVASQVADVLANKGTPAVPSKSQQTAALLHLLQIPTRRSGYRALYCIIPMYQEDPTQPLIKELYPAVAQQCGYQSTAAAEQSIRRAISAAWKEKNSIVWSRFFDVNRKCPTNWEFIARLAAELK